MQAKWKWARLEGEIVLVSFYSLEHVQWQGVIPNEAASTDGAAPVHTGRQHPHPSCLQSPGPMEIWGFCQYKSFI